MGISLRVDNEDIPLYEKLGSERQYNEINRLQNMSGIIGYENGNGNNGRLEIPHKSNFDLLG